MLTYALRLCQGINLLGGSNDLSTSVDKIGAGFCEIYCADVRCKHVIITQRNSHPAA